MVRLTTAKHSRFVTALPLPCTTSTSIVTDELPYTPQDIDEDDSGDESDESELESVAPLSKGPFKLGKYCQERARVFHEFSHWGMFMVYLLIDRIAGVADAGLCTNNVEHDLYHAYRLPYRQLLRRANLDPTSFGSQADDQANGVDDDDDDDPLSSDEEIKVIEKRPKRPFVPVAGFTKDTIRDGDEVLEYFERKGFIKSVSMIRIRLEPRLSDLF
jgi:hypothetical protein